VQHVAAGSLWLCCLAESAPSWLGVQHAANATGAGTASGHHAWRAYASAPGDARGEWRLLRSRNAALWFCAASFVCGWAIFYGALVSHEWLSGYDWMTPKQVDQRIHQPSLRRQQLLRLMMQERQQQAATLQQQQQQQQQSQQQRQD
jgi:hypothetical protein